MSTIKVDTVRPVTTDGSLTLQGDSSGSGVTGITIDSAGDVTVSGAFTSQGIDDNASSGPAVTIDSSGDVGIGTVSPQYKFHLRGADATTNFVVGNTAENTQFEVLTYQDDRVVLRSNDSGTARAIAFETGTNERMRIDSSGNLKFDSGYGSVATAYGCRAWVNFDGTSGSGTGFSDITIRASGNVSSITDNGTADYTVNFTTAMPDANYSAVGITGNTTGGSAKMLVPGAAQTTTACTIEAWVYNASQTDSDYVSVAIFR